MCQMHASHAADRRGGQRARYQSGTRLLCVRQHPAALLRKHPPPLVLSNLVAQDIPVASCTVLQAKMCAPVALQEHTVSMLSHIDTVSTAERLTLSTTCRIIRGSSALYRCAVPAIESQHPQYGPQLHSVDFESTLSHTKHSSSTCKSAWLQQERMLVLFMHMFMCGLNHDSIDRFLRPQADSIYTTSCNGDESQEPPAHSLPQ